MWKIKCRWILLEGTQHWVILQLFMKVSCAKILWSITAHNCVLHFNLFFSNFALKVTAKIVDFRYQTAELKDLITSKNKKKQIIFGKIHHCGSSACYSLHETCHIVWVIVCLTRGLPINRLIGLSRSFSLIGLGFGHLIFWKKYLA